MIGVHSFHPRSIRGNQQVSAQTGMPSRLPILLTVLCFLLLKPTCCSCSRILVVPLDRSHWINMEVILRELHSRGHNLTLLRLTNSWSIPSNSSFFTTINLTTVAKEQPNDFFTEFQQNVAKCRSLPFIRNLCKRFLLSLLAPGHKVLAGAAATMLDDDVFMKKLQDSKFDLMLTDPALPFGVILGNYLKLPMVFNVRWINSGDGHFVIAPSPVSYVPVSGSELHDKMDFQERAINMLYYLYNVVEQHFIIDPMYSDLFQRHFPPGTDLLSLERAADIWLFVADFVFEFPRPTMPNVVYIGGLQCKKSRPLPAELEAFMQSSGEHGVVVLSLGTYVSGLPRETTEAMAAAFAQLPQKVVWRFSGKEPSSLGNNTLLMKWLPQNDILGHPKTRAFVAHGGTNGLYEAIYHGVPVLGLPLLFDQFDNVVRLKVRGAARAVEVNSLTRENFLEALRDILETPSYRNNMQHLSALHHDRPMSPLDTAVFWIEYVIRNKGAAHLQPAGFSLPWYSYFCLDVAALIMALIGALVWASVFVCRVLCCRRFRSKIKSE